MININCDLGEGRGNDEKIMPLIHSCNIACGGHYGDASSMRTSIRLAKKYGVKCGAHPSFPDKENFGRKEMNISKMELMQSIRQQIVDFKNICLEEGMEMSHIKLHGALYNLAAKDIGFAQTTLAAIKMSQTIVPIYAPYQSVIARLAKGHFEIVLEAFADRRYHKDLSLVSRTRADAVITDKNQAWQQILMIANEQRVHTVEGEEVPIQADTFCVHGDQKNAVEILDFIKKSKK